jgi:hypothetical protein
MTIAAPPFAPPAAALNTILAVREHAPAEISELEAEIAALQQRLVQAAARKRLLEQLLETIQRSDDDAATRPGGMRVVR